MATYFETLSGLTIKREVLTEENFHRFVGSPASLEEVLKCTGIMEIYSLENLQTNPACTVVLSKYLGALLINIETPMAEMTRRLNFKTHIINNDSLRVIERGKDTGLYIFSGQRRAAISLGFRTIYCDAYGSLALSYDANGYYTWLRFGFELDSENLEKYYEMMWLDFGMPKQEVPTPNQLVAMDEFWFMPKGQTEKQKLSGRDFWRTYGFSFSGIFNLRNGSISNKAFIAYVDQELKDALSQRKRLEVIKKFIEIKLRIALPAPNPIKRISYSRQLTIIERTLGILVKKIEFLMDITQ